MNRKSIGYGDVAKIILFLVVFYFLFSYGVLYASTSKKGGDIEVCRLSVIAQAQTKLFGDSPTTLQCPRRQLKFFNDKVEINGQKTDYKFDKLDDLTVNRFIAEELRLCWYMMGQGEMNVFEQAVMAETDKVCAICTEVRFDSKVDKKRNFGGLSSFLKINKVPKDKVGGKDIFYSEYLIKSQKEMLSLLGGFIYAPWHTYEKTGKGGVVDDEKLEASKEYAVYFYAFKASWLNDKVGDVIGGNRPIYYIGIAEPSVAAEKCRRLVN